MPTRATKRGVQRTPLTCDCDVLICGASFAGLTLARELEGTGARVLMIDRYEIGERQTSACAAPTEWLDALGLRDSIRQSFGQLVVHTSRSTVPMPGHARPKNQRIARAQRQRSDSSGGPGLLIATCRPRTSPRTAVRPVTAPRLLKRSANAS